MSAKTIKIQSSQIRYFKESNPDYYQKILANLEKAFVSSKVKIDGMSIKEYPNFKTWLADFERE
jgi:hypothetical protein